MTLAPADSSPRRGAAADPPWPGTPYIGGYRPHLDGLRAVAMYLILAFHAGFEHFSRSFIAVDVFFVLSGYLVTQIILGDVQKYGNLRRRRFFARRVRRLLPAALVTLTVTTVVYSVIASGPERLDALGAVRAAFIYLANWHFIAESSDYFADDVTSNPVLHFWTLAIEEQFYLVWPLVLAGLFTLTRRAGDRQWHLLRTIVGAATLASLAWALHLAETDVNRAYYGTDTRAYQLLIGAFVALTPGIIRSTARARRALPLLSVAAVAMLVLSTTPWLEVNPIRRSTIAVGMTVALLIFLETGVPSAVRSALSTNWIAYLGKISYGTYLWHWMVMILLAWDRDVEPWVLYVVGGLIATALGSLSYHALEMPIRRSRSLDHRERAVIVAGVGLSIFGALVLAPYFLEPDRNVTLSDASSGDPASLDWQSARDDIPTFPNCVDRSTDGCVLVEGASGRVLLMGDSHAAQLIGAFEVVARQNDLELTVAVSPGCPWQQNLYFPLFAGQCEQNRADWYERLVPTIDPDLVVLAGLGVDDEVRPLEAIIVDGQPHEYGSEEFDRELASTTVETLRQFSDDQRRVLIIEPIPNPPRGFDPGACISEATSLADCEFSTTVERSPFESVLRDAAGHESVWLLDLDASVCPELPTCSPVVDDLIVRARNDSHLTVTFATSLSDDIQRFLSEQGVLA